MSDKPDMLKDFVSFMKDDGNAMPNLIELMDTPEVQEAIKEEFIRLSYVPDTWLLEEMKLSDSPENREIVKAFKNDLRNQFSGVTNGSKNSLDKHNR
jgi:hypothetical protein